MCVTVLQGLDCRRAGWTAARGKLSPSGPSGMTTEFRPKKGERVLYRRARTGRSSWRATIVLVVHHGDGVRLLYTMYTTNGIQSLEVEANVHLCKPIADEPIELKRHWDYLTKVVDERGVRAVVKHVELYVQLKKLGYKASTVYRRHLRLQSIQGCLRPQRRRKVQCNVGNGLVVLSREE